MRRVAFPDEPEPPDDVIVTGARHGQNERSRARVDIGHAAIIGRWHHRTKGCFGSQFLQLLNHGDCVFNQPSVDEDRFYGPVVLTL
jgi:hypothetical protein